MTSPTPDHAPTSDQDLVAGPPAHPPSQSLPRCTDDSGAAVLPMVDFKWLMAGEGHRIDLSRLQQDRAYARGCIALANASTCSALREAGRRMSQLLQVVAPRL